MGNCSSANTSSRRSDKKVKGGKKSPGASCSSSSRKDRSASTHPLKASSRHKSKPESETSQGPGPSSERRIKFTRAAEFCPTPRLNTPPISALKREKNADEKQLVLDDKQEETNTRNVSAEVPQEQCPSALAQVGLSPGATLAAPLHNEKIRHKPLIGGLQFAASSTVTIDSSAVEPTQSNRTELARALNGETKEQGTLDSHTPILQYMLTPPALPECLVECEVLPARLLSPKKKGKNKQSNEGSPQLNANPRVEEWLSGLGREPPAHSVSASVSRNPSAISSTNALPGIFSQSASEVSYSPTGPFSTSGLCHV